MDFNYLKQYVGARLDELTTIGVHSKQAPETIPGVSSFPYLIYLLSSSSWETRKRGDWICEIDFWDDQNDSSAIITAAEAIKAGFDYYWQSETQGYYQSHLEFYSEIPTGIPEMSRINQRYLLKVR